MSTQLSTLVPSRSQETKETTVVIECVMNSLADDEVQVQRVAADCFLEFFKWYDKSTDPTRAKNLLKRISAYARHPDANKRFAAAFAFNKIYHLFRENSDLGKTPFDFLSSFVFFESRTTIILHTK